MWLSVHYSGSHWLPAMFFDSPADVPDVVIDIWVRINRDTQTWTTA